VFYSAGYVSLASIVSVIVLPLAAWLLHLPRVLVGLAGLIALFVIVRHRANIRRLLDGTENKFVKKSRRPGGEPKP